jgi:hypothetical protein
LQNKQDAFGKVHQSAGSKSMMGSHEATKSIADVNGLNNLGTNLVVAILKSLQDTDCCLSGDSTTLLATRKITKYGG